MAKRRLASNLRVVSVRSILVGLAFSMQRAIWQPFVLSLGVPMSTLGLLEALGGWRGILPAPVQYVGGWLSDRLGRKPFIVVGNLAGLLGAALFAVAALTQDWRWLFPGVTLMGLVIVADPPQDSLVAESTPARQRGSAFSLVMLSWIAPGIVAPTIGGYLAGRWGYAPVFFIIGSLYGLALLVIVRFLRETLSQANGQVTASQIGRALLKMVAPPRKLRGLYGAMALDSFTWGLGWTILYGMLTETFGFTTFQIGLLSSMVSISWVLSQLPIGRLIDRYGSKPVMVFSEALGIPVVVGWLFSSSFAAFALLQLAFGITAATWVPAQRALVANSVSERERGEALGRLAAFQGLVGFPAPFIGGLLYDRFGFQAPILANLVFAAISTVVLALAIREPARGEEGGDGGLDRSP